MLDERWSDDVVDVSSALRSLLDATCGESVVRAAEAGDDERSAEVEGHLRPFGLYDLPAEPELLTAVSAELGRTLAPVPWAEVAAVRAVLDVEDAAYALDADPPAGPGSAVVEAAHGMGLVANEGARARTGAGDFLVHVDRDAAVATWRSDDAERLRAMMRLLAAARIVGASSRLVEIGVDYAKERHAFGRPIGSYQAVSHRLADAATAVEGAELLVKKVAWLAATGVARGVPQPIFGLMVWANAVDVGRDAARIVHQAMGGFGATLEYPAQLYSRRIRSWGLRLGRPGEAYREIARTLLDPRRREEVVGLWHEARGITIPRWVRELDRTESSER
jgi:hypothetical protein